MLLRNATLLLLAWGSFACRPAANTRNVIPSTADTLSVLASGLHVPWGMDLLPDGNLLFNQRDGAICLLNRTSGMVTVLMERQVNDQAEGGLLGLAADPDFLSNSYIYIYETVAAGNQVVRLQLQGHTLRQDSIILSGIPHAKFHDGGILRFGPDGFLYVGTGDARQPDLAQDRNSLAGKILRIDRNGTPADGNPFGNAVFSYGHRNVQGLAWSEQGQLYATEHGPSGELNGWCCHDELNKIIAGGNYGWPMVTGDDERKGCIAPLAHSGEDTWAPGGLVWVNENGPETLRGKLVFACLRGRKLLVFDTDGHEQQVLFDGTFKRLRNIIQIPDGSLVFCSSNKDGREALPLQEDDHIYLLPAR